MKYKHSIKTRIKMSDSGQGKHIGILNGRWRGGNSGYWKKIIIKRDGRNCNNCKKKIKGVVHVDHIIPKSIRKDLVRSVRNMQVLCPYCHNEKSKKEWHLSHGHLRWEWVSKKKRSKGKFIS